MRHHVNVRSWLVLGMVFIVVGSAAAQSISGFSVSTSGSTGNSGNGDGATTSSVAIQVNTATQVKSRFAWNVNADTGVFSTRDQSGNAQHNVSFSVTAPGSYFLTVATQRTGDMNRVSDVIGCEGAADVGAVTGTFTGGTQQAGGSLNLADPGSIANGSGDANTPFNQTASAQINRTSNGVAQAHTLKYTWSGNVRSNSCEAAVRVGEGSGATSGCSACGYPGSPSRTQATDGQFETVTLTNLCGNGVVDTSATFTGITSEQCDQGSANGSFLSCCTSTCQFKTGGTVCRNSAGVCDPQETCTGSSGTCPADAFEPSSTVCRASAGVCDVAENCTGSSAACPANAFEPGSTVCRPSAGVCDLAENCTGSAAACPADAKSTAVCRGSAGVCDVAESCDGVSNNCPADAFEPSSTVCRGSAGVCDVAENCTGSSAACPADAFEPSSTVCRGSAGVCDVAENCTGSSAACPADAFEPGSTVCRPAAGVCDVPESCTGSGAACPADSVSGAFVACRPAAGACDLAENCDGSTVNCPADAKSTALCRASAGVCDVAENCDGVNDDCPADGFQPSSTVCRGSAGVCDVAENCTGSGPACPANAFQPSSTVCRSSTGTCDVPESCTGSSPVCPADTGLPDSDSDTVCDAIDNCVFIPNTSQTNGDGDQLGDACDPCTNIVPTVPSKTKLILSKLLPPNTDDKLNFKGFFSSVPTTPTIDPVTNGLRVLVSDSAGAIPIDVTVPAGAYNAANFAGWKVGGAGTSWKYSNRGTVVPLTGGIYKAQLKAYPSTPGKYKFAVKGKNANYSVNTANLPLTGTLVIDVPYAATGQCGETAFQTAPARPNCTVVANGNTVRCK